VVAEIAKELTQVEGSNRSVKQFVEVAPSMYKLVNVPEAIVIPEVAEVPVTLFAATPPRKV
jgi:hypothetical protein